MLSDEALAMDDQPFPQPDAAGDAVEQLRFSAEDLHLIDQLVAPDAEWLIERWKEGRSPQSLRAYIRDLDR